MIFWIICCAITYLHSSAATACLPSSPATKFLHYDDLPLGLVIQSNRIVGSRMAAEALAILLEDQLGYMNVSVLQVDDQPDMTSISRNMWGDEAVPKAMIDLNVPLSTRKSWTKKHYRDLFSDCGSVAPPSHVGLFIPKVLYKRFPAGDHWKFYLNSTGVDLFDVNDKRGMKLLIEYSACNESYCKNGMYIPKHCLNQSCATLLTSHPSITSFIKDQIDELKLYMKVAWLGNNLKVVINKLHEWYNQNRSPKSIVFMEWTPGYFTLNKAELVEVSMPPCSHDTSSLSGCEYGVSYTTKLLWNHLQNFGPIHELLYKMSFDRIEYESLLRSYDSKSYRNSACSWLLANNATWTPWIPIMTSIEEKKNLKISGMFLDKSLYGAVQMAKYAINSNDQILKDYELGVDYQLVSCDVYQVDKQFLGFAAYDRTHTQVGILGPPCSEPVENLVTLSNIFHTIMISYSAEGTSYSDRSKNPYFFRTIGENGDYKHVYLELFKHFGWSRFAALAEDGQKYTEYISTMGDFLKTREIHLLANAKFPKDSNEASLNRHLNDLKSKNARIIIADVYDEVARVIMCQAYHLNMTAKHGYVWFLPGWLPDKWYNTTQFNAQLNESVKCNVDVMQEAIDGYFSLNHVPYGPDDAIMQENITIGEWKSKLPKLSVFSGFTYDAVWMFGLALNSVLSKHPEYINDDKIIERAKELQSAMENMEFNGVTGRVKFIDGLRFSDIEVLQWNHNKSVVIGSFAPNVSESKAELLGGSLKVNDSLIRWLVSGGGVPDDGFLPPEECSVGALAEYLNMSCVSTVVMVNVVFSVLLILLLGTAFYLLKRRYDKKTKFNEKLMRAIGFDTNGGMNLSDLDKWETDRKCVVLNRVIGTGAFGTVYGGDALLTDGKGWVPVAVKTLKPGSKTDEKLDFLSEVESMKRFDHKNIVKLLGVCTKSEPLYTIMEFMLYGDLKTYLLARRHLVGSEYTEEKDEISNKKLTAMALDVARALSYLAELRYVHRDVACRNCLLSSQRVVKLSDFGLTRPMFENDCYRFSRRGMLPVRWMAPESIGLGVFTPASDVWSFGVLLYEIITFGSLPFQGLSNSEVLELIKNGQTVKIPSGVKPQLEGLMKSCWNMSYKTRPNASEIAEFIANSPRLISPCLDVPAGDIGDFNDDIDVLPEALSRHTIPDEPEDLDAGITLLDSMNFTNPSYIEAGVVKSKCRRYSNNNQPRPDEETVPFV